MREMNKMKNKRKKALLFVLIITLIMALAMSTMNYIFGYNYENSEMVKVLIYFEIIMSMLSIFMYQKLFSTQKLFNMRLSFWFLPYIILIIITLVAFFITGDFTGKIPIVSLILVTTLLVGISEEVVFRGIVLQTFLQKGGIVTAILVSAILFSLFHAVNIFGGASISEVINQMIGVFLGGIVYACLSINLKSFIPLIIYHCLWDFLILSNEIVSANIEVLIFVIGTLEFIILIPIFIYTVIKFNKGA